MSIRSERPNRPRPLNSAARRQKRRATTTRRWITLAAAGAILLAIAVMAAFRLLTPATSASGPVAPEVLRDLASVSQSTANMVGSGRGHDLLVPVRAPVLQNAQGQPKIIYYGAEYCPYCAAERWALIVALNRFGSFTDLRTSHSAVDDVYPATPTFTFYGSHYQSRYLAFEPIELQTNQRAGASYQTLQTPTPEQQQLFQRYNAPPYVSAEGVGGIPFLDIANQYIAAGSSVDPGLLRGQTQEEIAAKLNNPQSAESQAIIGEANRITAAMCTATNNQPAETCDQPAIKQIQASLTQRPVPAASSTGAR